MQNENNLSSEKVIEIVSDYFSVSVESVKGQSRKGQIALARHFTCYFMADLIGLTEEKIGEILDNRDHSTINHSKRTVNNYLDTCKRRRRDYNALTNKFSNQFGQIQ